jgi:putative thioredoxin
VSVRDATDQTFDEAVVERSRTVPVVVDFWAEWCGPCRQLGPVIEQAVEATDGAVELVKVDVDQNPGVAMRYRVQGIPAVKAFKGGRMVDEFTGAVPRAAVESFLRGLLPSEADRLAALGDADSLRRALELQPNHPAARAALTRLESAGDPVLGPALTALEEGETERGLELLLAALEEAGGDLRERIRQLMIGVFAELGQDDPLATRYRRRLAAVLY